MTRIDRITSATKIIDAAKDAIVELGLTKWTVEGVARRLNCAKGLILYHFGTKEALLQEVGSRLLDDRVARRIEAIARGGTDGLDHLWQVIEGDVNTGISRAWLALITEGPEALRRPNLVGWSSLSAAVATALQLSVPADPGEDPLDAVNGFELALLQGRPPEMVRESYDRYWLRVLDQGV